MEVPLAQLLTSFVSAGSEYTLARLEFAMRDPNRTAPPLLNCPSELSEETLRGHWPTIEAQLEAAIRFTKQLAPPASIHQRKGASRGLQRTVAELDRYGRAIRWALTVTEK